MHTPIRHAAVAGRFYPSDPATLLADVQSYLTPPGEILPAFGCVTPHAGYIYSGAVAGAVFARIALPQRCIILCPNHIGHGSPLSITGHGVWDTPLGHAAIDSNLAADLIKQFPLLSE